MKTQYLPILILFYCVYSKGQTWNLVWSDEFDSTGINTSNWTHRGGGFGFSDDELEYYTGRSVNSTVAHGNLLIVARKERYSGNNYTSAYLQTQGLRSFTYGKIEARMKLPMGKGLWPAFWLLGNNFTHDSLPGEIDIMEHINNVPYINGTMHWDNNGVHDKNGGTTLCGDVTEYHVYSVEWDSAAIKWFVDGDKYWEGDILNNINNTGQFHFPFYIILNLAVGGKWPGNPDSTTPFPDTLYVDYVRVYQPAASFVEDGHNQVLDHFSLSQNFPNPFNSSTTIKYGLPARSTVRLVVYNILGQVVKELINSEQQAGYQSVVWNANVSSGIYFYRIEAISTEDPNKRFVETKKMLLLK